VLKSLDWRVDYVISSSALSVRSPISLHHRKGNLTLNVFKQEANTAAVQLRVNVQTLAGPETTHFEVSDADFGVLLSG